MIEQPGRWITMNLFGFELACHVLDNGQQIIEPDSVANLLRTIGEPMPARDGQSINNHSNVAQKLPVIR